MLPACRACLPSCTMPSRPPCPHASFSTYAHAPCPLSLLALGLPCLLAACLHALSSWPVLMLTACCPPAFEVCQSACLHHKLCMSAQLVPSLRWWDPCSLGLSLAASPISTPTLLLAPVATPLCLYPRLLVTPGGGVLSQHD